MKRKLKGVLTAAGLLVLMNLQAQEKKIISLNDAIDLSIKNSHQLKSDQAKIEEAIAAVKEASEKRLPNASISGS